METNADALAPEFLAAKILSRALHDIAGATSGLTAALDLLGDADNSAFHADALILARDSLAQMSARIAFCRAAFGGAGTSDRQAFADLIEIPFAGSRARLEGSELAPDAPPIVLQGALILVQISAEALASGGAARLSLERGDGAWRVRVDGAGAKARLIPETLAGLGGLALESGLAGRWAPARYLHAVAASVGGALDFEAQDGRFWVAFKCPD